jgi:hypothetical protein
MHLLRIRPLDVDGEYINNASSNTGLTQRLYSKASTIATNLIHDGRPTTHAVQVLFFQHAEQDDIAVGTLHAFALARYLSSRPTTAQSSSSGKFDREEEDRLIRESRESLGQGKQGGKAWMDGLASQGWDTEHIFLEEKRARVVVAEAATWPPESGHDDEEETSGCSDASPAFCLSAEKGR